MTEVTILQRLLWCINTIFHQMVAVIFCYIVTVTFVYLNDANSKFAWHIVLCSTGFILLMMEGFIIFTNPNIYTLYIKRIDKYPIHGIIMALATVCITAGMALQISNVADTDGSHFGTNHSRVALASLVLLWVTVCGGVMVSQIKLFGRILPANWLKLCHYAMGVTTLCLGVTAFCLGINNGFFRNGFSNDKTVTSVIVATSLVLVWALVDPCISCCQRVKSIFG